MPKSLRTVGSWSPDAIRATAQLLFFGKNLNHRKVQKIQILSPRRVRQQISTDFTLPGSSNSAPRDYLVPVAMVAKRDLARVDMTDESGRSLPIVNIDEERVLAYNLLLVLWKAALINANGEEPSDDERAKIEAEMTPVWDILRLLIAAEDPAEQSERSRAFSEAGWRASVSDRVAQVIEQMALLLSSHGILFAVLQGASPGSRRIVKVCFDDVTPIRPTPRGAEAGRVRAMAVALARFVAFLGRNLGWLATRVAWDLPGASDAASYHIEMEAPAGMLFVDAYLSTEYKKTVRDRERVFRDRLTGLPGPEQHAHLYLGRHSAKERLAADFLLLPSPLGWPFVAAVIASAVAVAALAVSRELDQVQRVGSAPGVAAAFLGAGAIAVTYLARPPEHALTAKLLRASKVVLLVNAAAAACIVALLLFAGPTSAAPTDGNEAHLLDVFGSPVSSALRTSVSGGDSDTVDWLAAWLTRHRHDVALAAAITALLTWVPVMAWPVHRLAARFGQFSLVVGITALAFAMGIVATVWIQTLL